jgi:hypothetical protein
MNGWKDSKEGGLVPLIMCSEQPYNVTCIVQINQHIQDKWRTSTDEIASVIAYHGEKKVKEWLKDQTHPLYSDEIDKPVDQWTKFIKN